MSNPNENTPDLQNDTDLLSELEPDWRSAPVGASVVANDGQTIGSVRSKADDGLFVGNDQDQDEFFITASDIASVEPGGVKLLIAASEVMRARPETDAADASQSSDAASQQPS